MMNSVTRTSQTKHHNVSGGRKGQTKTFQVIEVTEIEIKTLRILVAVLTGFFGCREKSAVSGHRKQYDRNFHEFGGEKTWTKTVSVLGK